jgi:uncharacterized protein YifE (UPF0438 family)
LTEVITHERKNYLIAKTIEQLVNRNLEKVYIKTLRVIDMEKDFKTVKSILLEELPYGDDFIKTDELGSIQNYPVSFT